MLIFALILFTFVFGRRQRRKRQNKRQGMDLGSLLGTGGGANDLSVGILSALLCGMVNSEKCKQDKIKETCPTQCAAFDDDDDDLSPGRRRRRRRKKRNQKREGLDLGSLLGGGDGGMNVGILSALVCGMIKDKTMCEKDNIKKTCPTQCAAFDDDDDDVQPIKKKRKRRRRRRKRKRKRNQRRRRRRRRR